ncbi:CPBP family intramembrane glutamic endopeptidase [Halarchaeum sp. P4]|uniref:CPBP family intramembrane glutamic endopeptidase n=1 Tax=Halarchaeum sp. P4 TaxID=3421639 RepID=UPI003EB993E2
MSSNGIDRRRVGLYLLVAFGVSWLTALAIYATGGLTDSQRLVGGLTVATVLLPTAYMFGPSIGHVAVRLVEGEGFGGTGIRPKVRAHLWTYAVAWLLPVVLTIAGAACYFAVFPGRFDPSLEALRGALAGSGVDPMTALLVQTVVAVTVAPLLNAIPAFGEEYGWRAFLLPELEALGVREAVLVHGLVWGVWHWPLIAMGYEYGFTYPGFPVTGFLVFCVFTVAAGAFLAWLWFRTESVWAPSVGHGAINASAGLGLVFVAGDPDLLFGPLPVGLLGMLPYVALALLLFRRPDVRRPEAV